MDLDAWLVFLPAAVLVAASPGANNFLALANGMRSGLVPAVVALAGRFNAFALLILLVVVGLGAVLAASETAFTAIK
jgi:threonine/homoserine/homoserine lactone efflux protein